MNDGAAHLRDLVTQSSVLVRFALVGGIALALAGCAGIDRDLIEAKTPDAPDRWAAADRLADDDAVLDAAADPAGIRDVVSSIGALPEGDWVASFNDPQLGGLIDEAIRHNNNLQAAAANLAAARSNVTVARAGLFPTLDTNGSAGRIAIVRDPTIAAQAGGGGGAGTLNLDASQLEDQFGIDRDDDGRLDGLDLDGDGFAETPLPNRRIYINNYQLSARISWELDVWGRIRDETGAAYNEAFATLADLDGARLSVATQAAQGWYDLIEARLQRELAERTVEARSSSLRVTERRYQRGIASSLDVRLSRSQLASDQATLLQRKQQEQQASRRLEVLLGRYPSAELAAADALPVLPSLAGAGAPGDILARRPDILAAEARMEAAGLRSSAARKQLLPQLSISANVNTSGPVLADVIDPERLAGNLFSSLAQPIFQGGRLRANAKRARAQAEAAIFNYAQIVLSAYEEAENALAAEVILAGREEALRLAYEEALAGQELTERRYNSGATNIFNLLDAQTRRIVAESQYITVTSQRLRNRVQLYLAIGGSFVTEPSLLSASLEPEEAIYAP